MRLGYTLAVIVVVGLTVAYAKHRSLHARYQELKKDQVDIQTMLRECEALDRQLEESRDWVKSRADTPLEIEADSRRTKNLVREGETIYRLEETPAPAAETGASTAPGSP